MEKQERASPPFRLRSHPNRNCSPCPNWQSRPECHSHFSRHSKPRNCSSLVEWDRSNGIPIMMSNRQEQPCFCWNGASPFRSSSTSHDAPIPPPSRWPAPLSTCLDRKSVVSATSVDFG